MIARPKQSRVEWALTERGAFKVGTCSPLCGAGEAMRKKAVRLQEELNELTEGAGLVKVFRERFLLWDGRNLLLRMILFRG